MAKNMEENQKDKKQKLEQLETKDVYNSYQEDLAFEKELNILRNDFYYQMIESKDIVLVDFLYQPIDIMSGDAYTARRVDKCKTFYLIVDGMGKGLSASITAMTLTTFVNHLIDKMKEHNNFSLDSLIKESINYIKPILLDEEAISVEYILFDTLDNRLHYSKFAMPVSLLQNREGEVFKLKSNNPPLSKWQINYKIDEYNIENIDKFLFCSNGLVENSIKSGNDIYGSFIKDDFASSLTREELKDKFYEKIAITEDDITFIFISRLPQEKIYSNCKIFSTSLDEVERASEWYNSIILGIKNGSEIIHETDLIFTEFFMNAYEHGNLGITASEKHKLIEEDIYYETLEEKEKNSNKKIEVKVCTLSYKTSCYVITQITDEGKGFDTQILSKIFRNSRMFNGRGVFMSRKKSLGIYYNTKGNAVLYLNKIDRKD